MEYPCRRKDGADIQCTISASRIGEKLENRSIVITFENITYRKQFEKELEISRVRLSGSLHAPPDGEGKGKDPDRPGAPR